MRLGYAGHKREGCAFIPAPNQMGGYSNSNFERLEDFIKMPQQTRQKRDPHGVSEQKSALEVSSRVELKKLQIADNR